MALDTSGPDGLTPVERLRQNIRDTLRQQFPNLPDEDIWANTLAITEAIPGHWLATRPTSLTYAWSDGLTFSAVDLPGGTPNDARERALLRALLTHALQQLDRVEIEGPLQPIAVTL